MSMGSSIFALCRPEDKYVSRVINNEMDANEIMRSNESPFIMNLLIKVITRSLLKMKQNQKLERIIFYLNQS